MPDVIEKKWRLHDDLAVTVNDAAPWHIVKFKNSFGPYQIQCQLLKWFGQACFESLDLTYIINNKQFTSAKSIPRIKVDSKLMTPKAKVRDTCKLKAMTKQRVERVERFIVSAFHRVL